MFGIIPLIKSDKVRKQTSINKIKKELIEPLFRASPWFSKLFSVARKFVQNNRVGKLGMMAMKMLLLGTRASCNPSMIKATAHDPTSKSVLMINCRTHPCKSVSEKKHLLANAPLVLSKSQPKNRLHILRM